MRYALGQSLNSLPRLSGCHGAPFSGILVAGCGFSLATPWNASHDCRCLRTEWEEDKPAPGLQHRLHRHACRGLTGSFLGSAGWPQGPQRALLLAPLFPPCAATRKWVLCWGVCCLRPLEVAEDKGNARDRGVMAAGPSCHVMSGVPILYCPPPACFHFRALLGLPFCADLGS